MDRNDEDGLAGLSGDLKDAIARGDTAYLLNALDDASLEVRIAAIGGLGSLGGEQARLALLRTARDRWGERPDVRIAALRSLKKVSEPDRYIALLESFIAGENRLVQAAARSILRDIDPDGYPGRLLARGCVDHAAIRVYGVSRERAAAPLLASFLKDRLDGGDLSSTRQWGKAYAAVRALGNIGGGEAVESLSGLLSWLETAPPALRQGFAGQRLDKIREAASLSLEAAAKE
jgi:HEAT repeat protein